MVIFRPRFSLQSHLSTKAAYIACTICTLAFWVLLASCSNSQDNDSETTKPEMDWVGTQEAFQQSFDPTSGSFVFLPEKQVYSGSLRITGSPVYEVQIRDGIPVKWVESTSGTPILRWYQEGCWIGIDSAWEEDFKETENGLLYLPTDQLYTGKVFSMNQRNGQILVVYAYKNGVSDGPEIYYDDNMQEESRIVWVNGVIPVQKL